MQQGGRMARTANHPDEGSEEKGTQQAQRQDDRATETPSWTGTAQEVGPPAAPNPGGATRNDRQLGHEETQSALQRNAPSIVPNDVETSSMGESLHCARTARTLRATFRLCSP